MQGSVLLETAEVISENFQSSKSARLQKGAIRKVHMCFSLPWDKL